MYVARMAYLVYALIQYAIRRALPEGEKLEIEGRKTAKPTAQAVLDVMAHVGVYRVTVPGQGVRRVLLSRSARAMRILELLGVDAEAFVAVLSSPRLLRPEPEKSPHATKGVLSTGLDGPVCASYDQWK